MVTVNSKGEIADVLDVSQFIGGRSAYECCAYSASLIYYSGAPGHGATGTTAQASNLAQYWYGKEEGSTAATNTNGMSIDAMQNMLQGMGLKYNSIAVYAQTVKEALAQGYPVMLCGAETGMHDIGLGDRVPYAWTPSGNHCIVVSGIASDGNLLVHDCASIAPTGVRPGPRVYDAAKLQIVSATAVTPRWKGNQPMSGVPIGWHQSPDGTVLYSPNNKQGGPDMPITGPFMQYILNNAWDRANVALEVGHHMNPMEMSNPAFGSGFVQTFRFARLEMPDSGPDAGKVVNGWMGIELLHMYQEATNAATQIGALEQQGRGVENQLQALAQHATALQAQVAQLEAEIASHTTGIDPNTVKNFQQAVEMQAHDVVSRAQALEAALIVPLS